MKKLNWITFISKNGKEMQYRIIKKICYIRFIVNSLNKNIKDK